MSAPPSRGRRSRSCYKSRETRSAPTTPALWHQDPAGPAGTDPSASASRCRPGQDGAADRAPLLDPHQDRLGLPHDPRHDAVAGPAGIGGGRVRVGERHPARVLVGDRHPGRLEPVAGDEVADQEPADGRVAHEEGPRRHHLPVHDGGPHERRHPGQVDETEHALTILDGHGWYTGNDMKVICLLAKKNESKTIFRLIKMVDPTAFVSQSSVIGVYGEGFDQIKIKAKKDKKKQIEKLQQAAESVPVNKE